MYGLLPHFTNFAAMKMVLHIVGLRYYSWSGRMTELFDETAADKGTVLGQKLFLQRDYQCAEDAHAVMAWTLTEPVGHVAKVDLPLIAGVLEQGRCDVVVARIVALDASRRALVVVPEQEWPELPLDEQKTETWTWTGPTIPLPMMWAQADHLGRMMALMAQGELPYNEEVVERYMQCTVTDLSGDAYRKRAQLAQTLLKNTEPRMAEVGHTLLAVMDHMGSRERMADWYNLIMTALTSSPEALSMASRHSEMDLMRILTALRSFPSEIGREWLAGNTELFVRRLYYAQISRTDMLKLLSLVVLYTSACRRMQPAPTQPTIGVNLGGGCQMNVDQLVNPGTMVNIDQPRILLQP